ncbi:conserved protein of unknown function [Pseudomonas putida KT2440]|uniref:Uncharacterized protein n=1 Tax=Pseudomonas putida (strain ATCC 47054 / DSM 6125 / CFBP 8728 / NCIMB 11950 / KT2440) TaxID=160488 RepID=Q88GM0_PSEPK|nr:conserved protein of unknown function [Pseudomonas putida KT2440]
MRATRSCNHLEIGFDSTGVVGRGLPSRSTECLPGQKAGPSGEQVIRKPHQFGIWFGISSLRQSSIQV